MLVAVILAIGYYLGNLASKSEQKQAFEEVVNQRNVLSDIIKAYEVEDDTEDITIYQCAEVYLEYAGCDTTDLLNWSYCE